MIAATPLFSTLGMSRRSEALPIQIFVFGIQSIGSLRERFRMVNGYQPTDDDHEVRD
jgi:hypothetical protein